MRGCSGLRSGRNICPRSSLFCILKEKEKREEDESLSPRQSLQEVREPW